MNELKFGFTVTRVGVDGWLVYLPSEGDNPMIVCGPRYWTPLPHGEAVAMMDRFIAEARQARAALAARSEGPVD